MLPHSVLYMLQPNNICSISYFRNFNLDPTPVPWQPSILHFCTALASNWESTVRKEGQTNTLQCFLVIINIFIVKNTIK